MKRVIIMSCIALVMWACSNHSQKTELCEPMVIQGLEDTPDFWRVRPEQITDLCRNVRKGRTEVIATTPAGFPVYAYFYGEFNDPEPQTNWSASHSSDAVLSFMGDVSHPQTIMLLAGVHGSEPEGTAAAMNMIQMLETGKDFRGLTDTTFMNLASKYRLIIIPCANMDGRAISPDHLRGQPYEVFRAACQGTWKDGSLVGWKPSKRYFPLPLDQVSFPGGYPNSEGYNIQHDVTPGDMRTKEAAGICKLMSRWRVDAMLNAHSCQYAPHMVAPSLINPQRHIERGCEISDKVHEILLEKGLILKPRKKAVSKQETLNLSSIVNWCSGGFGLTLECSSSYDDINKPNICYTFDQLMEPVFVAMNVIMESGMEKPLAVRATK